MSRFPNSSAAPGAISRQSVQILAVAALDEMVTSLVKASKLRISPGFLDWVADEATPLVELSVERFFRNDRFMASLRAGDPKIAISLWVRHWVCPRITANFAQLAPHVAGFSESGPAPLAAEPPSEVRPNAMGMPYFASGGAKRASRSCAKPSSSASMRPMSRPKTL